MRASRTNAVFTANWLIGKGADVCMTSSAVLGGTDPRDPNETVLHFAAVGNSINVTRMIFEHFHSNCNSKKGDEYTIKELVDKRTAGSRRITALNLAAKYNNLEMVRLLIEVGKANVSIADDAGWFPIHQAVYEDNLEMVKYLVEKAHADVNVQAIYDGIFEKQYTPLHFAAGLGHLKVLKYLVEKANADIYIKDIDGQSILDKATKYSHLKVRRYLEALSKLEVNKTLFFPLDVCCFFTIFLFTFFYFQNVPGQVAKSMQVDKQ